MELWPARVAKINNFGRFPKGFVDGCGGLTISKILNDGAIDRLVLASGGVARDFLAIFRKAVDVARERGLDHRGPKIGSEDVNIAAGEHEPSKREELKRDAPDARKEIEEQFEQIVDFCVNSAKANLFLLDKAATGKKVDLLHELVDLRLIHLARSRITVSKRPGKNIRGIYARCKPVRWLKKKAQF